MRSNSTSDSVHLHTHLPASYSASSIYETIFAPFCALGLCACHFDGGLRRQLNGDNMTMTVYMGPKINHNCPVAAKNAGTAKISRITIASTCFRNQRPDMHKIRCSCRQDNFHHHPTSTTSTTTNHTRLWTFSPRPLVPCRRTDPSCHSCLAT